MQRRSRAVIVALAVTGACATPALAAGDARKGAQDFVVCQACHNVQKGGGNSIGPNLFGVAGRKAASVQGYTYSSALKNANITWSNDKLKAWIMGPQKLVPATKMTFAGLGDPAKADDVVAYLDSLK